MLENGNGWGDVNRGEWEGDVCNALYNKGLKKEKGLEAGPLQC